MPAGKPSLILAALLFTFQASAQAPKDPALPSAPTIRVFSRETIVDVIVTDSKGQPVRGLKKSDFTVQEDGNPQSIRGFGEFEGGANSDPQAPNLTPEIHSNLRARPTSGPVNILFIDALHLNFRFANMALQAVSAYAAQMPEGTQVAVFWLGASGLHMLQGFTTDPAAIQQSVATLRTDIGSNDDCYARDRLTISALTQVADYVAPIKGRKNLIWMTPGVPIYLLRDGGYGYGTATECHENAPPPLQASFGADRDGGLSLFTGPDGQVSDGLDMTQIHHLMDLYELFTAEQIAVSPLDPRGVGDHPLGGSQLVAEEVAEQSGGIASYNNNDLPSLISKSIDLGSHYYTVSYIPPRTKDDGHYHHITILVNQPGLRLIYRKGYNSENPKTPRQYSGPDLIKAALQGRAPAATQLLFDAKLVPTARPANDASSAADADLFAGPPMPTPQSKSPQPEAAKPKGKQPVTRTPYDLLLAVPQNQIAYGTAPNGDHTLKLQFAFDAYDLNGKLLGLHSQNVNIVLPPDRYARFIQAPVIFHEQISFLPGPLFLRIGILDATSNKVGTLEIPLTIPKQ